MAKKQQLRTLQEKNIGALGLKIPKLISKQTEIPEITQVVNGKEIVSPNTWRIQDVGVLLQNLPQRTNTQGIYEILDKITSHWRWWGETYGYFNRKIDAVTFKRELTTAIALRIVVPSTDIWKQIGMKQKTSTDWFIDPETRAAKQLEGAHQRPVGLSETSALNRKPELDENIQFSLFHVNPVLVDQLPNANHKAMTLLHIAKLVTIAADINIHMSRFATQIAAQMSSDMRVVAVNVSPEANEKHIAAIRAGCNLASAELALLHQTQTKESIPFEWETEFGLFAKELNRQEKLLIEYGKKLTEDTGIKNHVLVEFNLSNDSLAQLWDPDLPEEVIEQKFGRKIEEPAIEIDEARIEHAPAPIPKIEQTTITPDLPEESEALPTSTAEIDSLIDSDPGPEDVGPELQSEQIEPLDSLSTTRTNEFDSHTHLFKIQGIQCSVTMALEQEQPVWIRIGAYKCEPTVAVFLETTSHLLSKLAQTGMTLNEVGEELEGIAFSPTDEAHRSILDHVGNWIKSKATQSTS